MQFFHVAKAKTLSLRMVETLQINYAIERFRCTSHVVYSCALQIIMVAENNTMNPDSPVMMSEESQAPLSPTVS